MPDRFSVLAKLREIMRVLAKEYVVDAFSLAALLEASAQRPKSTSPFRRPIANDNGTKEFAVLELGTILNHIRFAEKLALTMYRSEDSPSLPGLEPDPAQYSDELVDRKVRAFLGERGISMASLEAALTEISFRDIDSLVEALRLAHGRVVSEFDLKRCVRILGDCGVSLTFSRKKTYAPARR